MSRLTAVASISVLLTSLFATGCNQNPYMTQPTAAIQQQAAAQQAQTYDITRRATELDANNRDLHAQLAQSRQQVGLLSEQVTLLQKQLGETAQKMQELQVAREQSEKKYQELQASTTRRGGAIITANSSLRQVLRPVEIEGLQMREEGDTIRVELPADQLFAPGTAQVVGTAYPILDRLASEIARNYPRQRIGIEGHTDSIASYGGAGGHQLSAAQAMAVFDQLTRRNRLPARQFVVAAMGSNQPIAGNDTQTGQARNRRVELVIYADSYEDY